MNAVAYRRLVDAHICVDCGSNAVNSVRCPDCKRFHNETERQRHNRGIYACSGCGERGHNAQRCGA